MGTQQPLPRLPRLPEVCAPQPFFPRLPATGSPLSFDLKRSENIKAKAFHWESLTRFLAHAPEKPNITLLLAAPDGEQRRAYDEAKDVLHSSHSVTLIEEDEAEDFARDMERRITALAVKSH